MQMTPYILQETANVSNLTTLQNKKASNRFLRYTMYSLVLLLATFFTKTFAQVNVNPGAGSYTTLKDAFDAINAGTHTGAITIDITGNTTETASAVLNASGTGSSSYTSIVISPSGGSWSVSGSVTGYLIDLNGADNVTIDGLNSGGNALAISNAATGASGAIRFINDASTNIVQNCSIQGSSSTASNGVVLFSTGTTTGNDGNNINNCSITASGANLPVNGIFSLGTSAAIDNSGNTINANNISDYFNVSLATAGINLGATGNTAWTITNNKLFQTALRLYTTGNTHSGISVGVGVGYTITGNIVGFANASGTGATMMVGNSVALSGTFPTAWNNTGSANATRYTGISCAFTAAGTVSNIQGNTIAGFALYTSSGAATANGIWCGINVTSGNVNIGTTSGNTIGATTGQGSVYAACNTAGGAAVGIFVTSTNNINIQNNNIGAIDAAGAVVASGSGGITGIDVGGTGGIATISNNTIGNTTANNLRAGNLATGTTLSSTGTFVTTTGVGAVVGIRNAATGGPVNITGNTLRGFAMSTTSSSASSAFTGITNTGSATSAVNITGNFLGTSGLGLINYAFAIGASSALTGINCVAAAGAAITVSNNDIRGIVHTVAGANAHTYIAWNHSTTGVTDNFNSNTFTNLNVNTSGSVTFLSRSTSGNFSATGVENCNSNSIVTGFNKGTAGGTVTFYSNGGGSSSVAGAIQNANLNNFSNVTLTGVTALVCWSNADGPLSAGTGPTKVITNNTFNNITTGVAQITGITWNFSGGGCNVSGNTLTNFNGGGIILGLSSGSSNGGTNTIASNTITNLTALGQINVIQMGAFTVANTNNINNNTIRAISTSSAANPVFGIICSAQTNNIFKNKIADIASDNAGGTVTGILVQTAGTYSVYNNYIGDLRTPTATGLNAIQGISVGAAVTANVYYNTVYLNAASTSVTTFGTSCIGFSSTATSFNSRNNILVNLSVPAQEGANVATNGISAGLRRTTGTNGTVPANYATSSNNNLYWVNPSGGTNNHLTYAEGTSAVTNPFNTFASFKAFLVNRDQSSGSEAVSSTAGVFFQSLTAANATFLHIVNGLSTLAESGAANISGITDDYDNDIRQGNAGYAGTGSQPDIGADEFAGVTPAPAITLNSVTPPATAQCTATARLVSVNVTTSSGTITSVTLNYNYNGAAQPSVTMTNTTGNTWTGTIPAATPANASVTWSVTAVNSLPLSSTLSGTAYSDAPTFGLTATVAATLNTVCSGSPTSLSITLNGSAAPSYTTPPAVTNPTTDEDFSNITITQGATTVLNNTSGINSLTGTIGTATGIAGSYSNFTAFGPYVLIRGVTYNLSVSSIQQGGGWTNIMGVWIDYNGNGSYSDAGETVFISTAGAGDITRTGSFTVPASAINGLVRMRVLDFDGSSITGPTQSVSFGEYEEYMLRIMPGVTTGYSWSDGTNTVGTTNPLVVSPLSNTTYTGSILIAGCPVSNTVAIATNPLPAAPVANNSTQCGAGTPGAFVTTGGGGGGYKWYLTPTGGTPIPGQSGGSLVAPYVISSPTHFYVSELQSGTGCEGPRVDVFADVTQPDAILASVDNNNPCSNSQIQLTATVTSGTNGNVYSLVWTASPASGSGIPTSQAGGTITFGSPATTFVTPTAPGTYTYTVTGTDGVLGCGYVATVVVTAKISPTNVVALSSVTPCEGAQTTLTSTNTSGFNTLVNYTQGFETWPPASWTFINAGSGNSWISSNTLTTPTPHTGTNAMAYLYNSSFAANTWGITPGQSMGAGVTYTISFWYNTASISGAYPERLKVTVGNAATVAAQTTILWNNNGGLNLVNETYAQGTATFTPSVTGIYYFGFNCYSEADRDALFVDDISITGGTNPASTYSWTSSPAGFTSSVQNPGLVTVNVPTTFTVTTTNVAGCSTSGSVTVTPYPLPPAPSGANGTDQCGTGLTDASVTSSNLIDPQVPPFFKWYDAPTGGTLKQSGTSTTYNTPITATTDFYVSEVSANGCEGPRVHFSTIVSSADPLTVTVTANDVALCLGESTDITSSYTPDFNNFATFDLTATGGAASGVTGTVSLTANTTGSDPHTVTPTAVGVYTYTVTAFDPDKGCTSVGTITITVSPLPGVTAGASAASVCTNGTVNLTATPAAPLINQVWDVASPLPAGWAAQNNSTVVGTSGWQQGDVATFVSHSGATNSYIFANFHNVSGDNTISNWLIAPTVLMSNGDKFTFWTRTPTGSTFPDRLEVRMSTNGSSANVGSTDASVGDFTTLLLSVNPTLAVSGYPEVWTQFTATISGLSVATSGRIAFRYFVEHGGDGANSNYIGIDDVAYTQALPSFSWTSNPVGFTSNTQNPLNVTVNQNTIYTVVATNSYGCTATSNVTVNVLPLPNAPSANNSAQCGLGVPTASVSSNGGGGNGTFNWYAASSGGTALQSGTSATYTTAISSTTTFYVSESGTNGCESPRTAVTVTVTTPPSISTTGSTAVVCANGTVTLNATSAETNYAYTWTASPSAGSGISGSLPGSANGTSSNTINPTTAGTYTYTVVGSENTNGCSAFATVVVTVNPNPPISSASASVPTVCAGGASNLVGISLDPLTFNIGETGDTGFGSLSDYGMYFSTSDAATINTVEIYPSTAGTLTVQLKNASSTVVDTRTFTIVAGDISTTVKKLLTLNFNIPAGSTGWQIYYTGLAINRGQLSYNYPYNANGFAITGNTIDGDNITGGSRYYFYNWNVTTNADNSAAYSWVWNPGNLSGSTVTVHPTSTTIYTVTATNNSTGCFSVSSPVTVNVTPVGANATATPSTPVCAGSLVTLNGGATGGGPFTYAWASTPAGTYNATASISVNPTVTTTYTVTVTDACSNSTTSSVTVTVNPLPAVSIQETGPIAICFPATQVLTAVTDAASPSYQWTLNGNNITLNGTNPTYNVSGVSTGVYRVRVTNGTTTCVNTSSPITVTINPQPAAVTVTPPTATICNGGSQLLTASGGTTAGTATATFGSGADVTTLSTDGTPYRVGNSIGNQFKNQYLFLASELQGQGITAGNITSVALTIAGAGGGTLSNFTIKMGATAQTALTSTYVTGLTTVLSLATYPATGTVTTGVQSHTFTTAFVWDGTSNIVLEMCAQLVSFGTAGTLAGDTQPFNATILNNPSTTACASATTGGGVSAVRPKVTFGYNTLQNPTWSWAPAGSLNASNVAAVTASPSTTTTYTATATNSFGCSNSGTAVVTVNPRPTATISGSGAFCQGAANTSTNLTVNFTGTAPWNYTYQVNNGSPVSGTTSSNPLTITVAPSSATAGLFTYTISALSDALCTATDGDWSGSGTVTINPLAATPTATVTQPTCALGTGSITMTAPLGTGNSYTLDGTTTITWPTITFTGVAPGPHTITVSNSFGCSAPASASVTVNPQPFTPTAPVVTGTVNICPHIGTGEQITYTATANGNGNMSFSWTLPPNVNVVSGLGTGTLVVTFPSAAIITQANKQIRVTATNQCGTSTMTIFYLLTQQPNTPNPISGPTDVCPLLGNAAGADYVINKAPGALSYLWSAQQSANVTITHPNGTGVNDTIIHVVFATGFTTSNITVQAVNDCGTSGARSLTVYRITPSTPGLIAGPTNACEFTAPNGTAATYSVAATPGVTYTWTVPSGATGLTGQGTSTISFTYPAGFTSGTISVTATNGCGGPSAPRSLSITKLNPATPSVIDVIQTHFCGENPVGNSRVYTYTLASMPANATSVQWVVPSGASLEAGQGSTSITVRYPDAAVNGVVTAQAVNNCGTSTIRSTVVKLPACPVGFTKAEEPANSNVQPKVKTGAPIAVAGASMEVKIFPNPTVSDFKLEVLTPGKEEINVRVIDAQGRMYKSFKLMPYQTIALGAELKAGSYLVEVRQGATVKTTKVIKF